MWKGLAHCGRCYLWAKLVVLDSIREKAEQFMGNKSVSNTPPWIPHQFLPLGSCPVWFPALSSFSGH